MPTSVSEAQKIVSIINEYIEPEVARQLMRRLDKEVGQVTNNDSLSVSLYMLRTLYETASKDGVS